MPALPGLCPLSAGFGLLGWLGWRVQRVARIDEPRVQRSLEVWPNLICNKFFCTYLALRTMEPGARFGVAVPVLEPATSSVFMPTLPGAPSNQSAMNIVPKRVGPMDLPSPVTTSEGDCHAVRAKNVWISSCFSLYLLQTTTCSLRFTPNSPKSPLSVLRYFSRTLIARFKGLSPSRMWPGVLFVRRRCCPAYLRVLVLVHAWACMRADMERKSRRMVMPAGLGGATSTPTNGTRQWSM